MIGIIGAMEEEVASLINQMEDAESKTMAGMTFNKGKLWNQDAVVVHFRHVFCTSNTR
jgi:adenosylhomocysteine nucleosidase